MNSGRGADSVAMAREALALARLLHTEDPDRHAEKLARALEHASYSMASSSGMDPEIATSYARDAVALRQQLSADEPDQLMALIQSFETLAHRHSDMGRYQEVVQVVEQEIATLEALAEADSITPSMQEFTRQQISDARARSAPHLLKVGRVEEAIRRARAKVMEEERADPAHDLGLAIAYGQLADVLREAGRPAEAVDPAVREVKIFIESAKRSPGQHLGILAERLNALSVTFFYAGLHDDAVKAARQVVTILRRLAEFSPSRNRPTLAMMLGNLRNVLAATGRHGEAIDAAREAVVIWEELESAGSGNSSHLEQARQQLQSLLDAPPS
jgi:tetratricopeptide (TPR) repeat protein